MPGTTVTFIRIPVMVGRSTTMEAGIPWISLRLRPIGAGQKTRSSGPAPETLTPIERARVVTIEVARKQAARVVAAATIVPVEAVTVGPRNAITCSAKRRIGRGVDRRANASKTFSGVAAIVGAVAVVVRAAAVVVAVAERSQLEWRLLLIRASQTKSSGWRRESQPNSHSRRENEALIHTVSK
jgi:hypothetical protein